MYATDIIKSSGHDLKITFLGHGTLMFTFGSMVIHVDPVSDMADYTNLPKADIILVTHEHSDHFESKTIEILRKDGTVVVGNKPCAGQISDCIVMKNGDVKTIQGLEIEAVPAYNIVHMRTPGNPFHPQGVGNGYVITFNGEKVYIAGDTENISEMKELKGIDVAFLPMNLPYTMTPEMVVDAARVFKPKILYPYHFGSTDTSTLIDLLKDNKEIEVRIRDMQ
jgi:L-ascorbate metabolism protein UlaG (beta-lactamase superfamily)